MATEGRWRVEPAEAKLRLGIVAGTAPVTLPTVQQLARPMPNVVAEWCSGRDLPEQPSVFRRADATSDIQLRHRVLCRGGLLQRRQLVLMIVDVLYNKLTGILKITSKLLLTKFLICLLGPSNMFTRSYYFLRGPGQLL